MKNDNTFEVIKTFIGYIVVTGMLVYGVLYVNSPAGTRDIEKTKRDLRFSMHQLYESMDLN